MENGELLGTVAWIPRGLTDMKEKGVFVVLGTQNFKLFVPAASLRIS